MEGDGKQESGEFSAWVCHKPEIFAIPVQAHMSQFADISRLCQKTVDKFLEFDILGNNGSLFA